MVGQDAVRSAKEFNDSLELTGVVLTKLDGDARGGAALSIKEVTSKPIRFVGTGEKLEGTLEEFRAEGMAQRILGFGDVLGLVGKAQEVVDRKESEEMQKHLLENTFTFEHFLKNLRAVKKMGSVKDLLKMVPGMSSMVGDEMDEVDDSDLGRIEAIIQSMTVKERRRPEILNTSRRNRVAKGAGVERPDVDDLIKQFAQMKKMMDGFGRKGGRGPLGKLKQIGEAKKKMADIGGMMQEMTQGMNGGGAPRPKGKGTSSKPSRDQIQSRRKQERKARRKNRKKKR